MKTKSAPASKGTNGASNGASKKNSGNKPGMPGNTAAKKSSAPKKNSSSSDSSSEVATGLRELFEDMLKDIYWAEKALTKALPKMAKKASSEELVNCLQDHLATTQEQVSRLEQVFEIIGKPARAKKCEAMDGLVKEAEEIMESTKEGVVRDAGIIAAGQKVEHYEIATYGTLVSFARTLGEDEAMGLLEQTLEEEKEADQLLTEVAESAINIEAADEDDDNSDEDGEESDDDSDDEDTDDSEDEAEDKNEDDSSGGDNSKRNGKSPGKKK